MSLSLADLKKSRSLDFGNITKALSKTTESGYSKDEDEYYKPTRDKAGNGSAVLRFLNTTAGDELPWVQIYSHAFQGPTGRWYIENCRSTLGEDDPVNVANKALWATGNEKDKEIVRKQKRKLQYVANILVISDPGNRDNEGKVFKFKFGKKIWEKILEKLEPTFAEDKPINVFDYWEGANFKLRIRQVEGYPNYDQSVFDAPSALAETDEEILEVANQQKPLRDLIDPKNFKSYEELEKKFKGVMQAGPSVGEDAPAVREARPAPVKEARAPKEVKPVVADADEEGIEDYFKSIAS